MTYKNFMHVSIPLQFDLRALGILNEEDGRAFLERMCEESTNQPIIKDEKAVGFIQSSEIDVDKEIMVCNGIMWCHIGNEVITKDGEGFRFGAIVIS